MVSEVIQYPNYCSTTDATLGSDGGTTDQHYEYRTTADADIYVEPDTDYPQEEPDPPVAVNEELTVKLNIKSKIVNRQLHCRDPPPAGNIIEHQLL